jgi:hypothetical protein
MNEVIRHTKLCFNQFKQSYERTKPWHTKNMDKFDNRNKKLKHPRQTSHSAPIMRNKYNGQQSVSFHNNSKPADFVNKAVRPPLQCWG